MRAARKTKQRLSLAAARANALELDWSENYRPPRPSFLGARVLENYPLAELRDYIDWSPFFATWELSGKFPAILDDAKYGNGGAQPVRGCAGDARAYRLRELVRAPAPCSGSGRPMPMATTSWCTATTRALRRSAVLHTLRQQLGRREGRANVALADFVAPRDSGIADYIGAFMVTAGIGEDEIAERFKRAHDDYSAIMVKALADRLAEAFAERLHQRVRTRILGAMLRTRRSVAPT